ncbi:MAG: ribose transport system substrate-binding protein [Thermoleophilaceae bacterium]|jgi:ribose transport system substrate-binding protein|nr:ribose transport system substrate-binding protein [Thermoleophilaceae bacterium]
MMSLGFEGALSFGRLSRAAALGALVLSLAAAGCGGDDDGGGEADAGGSSAGGTDAYLATAKQKLEDSYAGKSYKSPPTTAPKPEPGKNVWVIVFGTASSDAAVVAEQSKEIGEMLGWNVTIGDGKFDPSTDANLIRQAVAAKADGIVLYLIDCESVKSALGAAKRANIPVAAIQGIDCDEFNPGAERLYTYNIPYTTGVMVPWSRSIGENQAVWSIVASEGKGKAMYLRQTDEEYGQPIVDAFQKEFEKCSGCEYVGNIDFTGLDFGPNLQQKVGQALIQHPDVNIIAAPYDGVVTAGVAAAVRQSPRGDEVMVIGAEGLPENMDLIRNGQGQAAAAGLAPEWEGWAGMDAINRLMHGEPGQPSGIGVGMTDKEHAPATGGYQPPFDFKAIYKKAWGIE